MSKSINEILVEKSLFVIPVSGTEYSLLYAPLADSVMLLDKDEIRRIAMAITSAEDADDEALSVVETLCDVVPVDQRAEQIHDVNDFINLSILPNNICNFSCSYCYSAKGRSSQQLKPEVAFKAIDFFLSPERNKAPRLTVSIFGGGEPLLSWTKVVKPVIEYIYAEAERMGRNVTTTLITNGSTIPDGFIDLCRKYAIDLVCSFEILEDVQNSQRKHFETVSANIRKMIADGIVPAVNSVVTELNVARQSEMIEVLHAHYPQIRYAAFEPVIDSSISDREAFYRQFTQEFIAAEQKAGEYSVKLTCSVMRNVDVTVDRYCPGELALCADGSLSICPCVSSPLESNYQRYIYGQVSEHSVSINQQKLRELLGYNLHSQAWCNNCFARWNCGGGCTNTTFNNGGVQEQSYCHFVRRFLKYTLIKRLDKIYKEEYNENLQDIIGNYEHLITKEHI